MSAKKPLRRTFAEIVAEVPEASATGEEFSYSVPDPWITVDGQRWHLRRHGPYQGKILHTLLGQNDLLAFHDYMNKRTVITPEDREAFWLRALSFMEASDYSELLGYEYKGPEGGRCLVVYQCC